MVKKRRQYTKEFKFEAVQLAVESERSLAEVARDLGIAPNLLSRSVRMRCWSPTLLGLEGLQQQQMGVD